MTDPKLAAKAVAKMRAQRDTNRNNAQAIRKRAEEYRVKALATVEDEYAGLLAQAKAEDDEAALWEELAAEQEAKAGITALDVPAPDGLVASGTSGTAQQDGGPQE